MMNHPTCDCAPNDVPTCRPPIPPCPPSDVPTCRPPHPPIPPCPPCPPKDRNTPWYGLPQWSPATTVSFLVTMNNAMMCIDSALHNLALRTGIDGVPSDLVTTVEKLELETKDLKCAISKLSVDSNNFELKLANMTKSITTIQADISTLLINTSNLDTRMTTQEMKSTQLNATLTKLQENVAHIMETIRSINEQYQQMLQEHQDIKNTINKAQIDIANLKLKDTELESKDSELENRIIVTSTSVAANAENIEKLQTELIVTTTSIAAMSKLNDTEYKKRDLTGGQYEKVAQYYEVTNLGLDGTINNGELIVAAIGNTVTLYSTLLVNNATVDLLTPNELGHYGYKATTKGLEKLNTALKELGFDLEAYTNSTGFLHSVCVVNEAGTSKIVGVGAADLQVSTGVGVTDFTVKLGVFENISSKNIYFNQSMFTFQLPLKEKKE